MKKILMACLIFASLAFVYDSHAMLSECVSGGSIIGDGNIASTRCSRDKSVVTQDSHARYVEPVFRGKMYYASNQAGIATPAGLATASKNFTLYNPPCITTPCTALYVTHVTCQSQTNAASGGVYLVGNFVTGQAAPATTTAETVRNALTGQTGGNVGQVYNTATLAATPVIIKPLLGLVFTTSGMMNSGWNDETAGSIAVYPGMYISIQGSAAFTLVCSMEWEELAE